MVDKGYTPPSMWKCLECGNTKPLTVKHFRRRKENKTGFMTICKLCANKRRNSLNEELTAEKARAAKIPAAHVRAMCTGKHRYSSYDAALKKAARDLKLRGPTGKQRKIYQCSVCLKWHLALLTGTSKKTVKGA